MTAMGVALPHYINPDKITPGTRGVDGATEMLINQTITWIREYGAQYGWEKVTEEQAQIYANQGCPAITLYKNSGGHGHVQVIRPSDQEYNPDLGAYIAQAGSTNFNKGYTSQVYSSDMRENEIEYYIHK